MGFVKEFREFALKGNVMDMAVGVIIGGAFGKIISSLVNDILMPPLGVLIGNVDFRDLKVDISAVRDVMDSVGNTITETVNAAGTTVSSAAAEPVYWRYGAFIQECLDFTILALCVFLMVKIMNRVMMKKKEEAAAAPAPAPEPSAEEKLLAEIRDLLKKDSK